MLTKRWCYAPQPTEAVLQDLQSVLKTPPWVTKLLWQRGVRSLSTARSFFNPSLAQLHDPFAMQDMDRAVGRIWEAVDREAHIGIYGDYDVDGTTSVALLYEALRRFGGRHLTLYIPDRAQEGYGVSKEGVRRMVAQGVELLICVDCGTRAVDNLGEARRHGIETIVCDHHATGEDLPPTVAMLNPQRGDCEYPFQGLSACGIVFKLVQALAMHRQRSDDLTPYLDLVALSIAADIVPMVGENRPLMYHGLRRLNEAPRPGIKALQKLVPPRHRLAVRDIVFGLAPLINAAGRMDHARHAVKLLLAKDDRTAEAAANVLASHNAVRKKWDETTTQEALSMMGDEPDEGVVLHKAGWPKGIVGIVAARCVEAYHRPTLVLTRDGAQLTGSGRSVPGYNLYEAVHACAPWLTRYGGHAQAVGLSLPAADVEAFAADFQRYVKETLQPEHKYPTQRVDVVVRLADLTLPACRLMARMAPFGPGHRQPVCATWPVYVHDYKIYQGKHVKMFFRAHAKGPVWDAIGFNMADAFLALYPDHSCLSIAYQPSVDVYQGIERIQLVLKDFQPCPHDPAELQLS